MRIALAALLLAFPPWAPAASVAPVPGDAVLIIYVNDGKGTAAMNNIRTSLNAMTSPPSLVDTLPITVGDTSGLNANLTAAGKSLSSYCQVWDIRFDSNNGGSSTSPCGVPYDDRISNTGPNNDTLVLMNFLAQGGHLFLVADNLGFCSRNEGVINFTSAAVSSGTLPYPNTVVGPKTWSTFDNTGPDNFKTNYSSALTSVDTVYAGEIPTGSLAGGKALTTDGAGYALDILWDSTKLTAGNGKLAISFDSNINSDSQPGFAAYDQHMYVTLSTCYNFTVTKSVSPPTVCAGSPATFTVCYHNTGTRPVPAAVITDTLPNCTTYSSSTVAPSGNGGQLYWWNLGTVNPGPQVCIDITVNTSICP